MTSVKLDPDMNLLQVAQEVSPGRPVRDGKHAGRGEGNVTHRRRNFHNLDEAVTWAKRWVKTKHRPCSIKAVNMGGELHWPLLGIVRYEGDADARHADTPIVFDRYDTSGRLVNTSTI